MHPLTSFQADATPMMKSLSYDKYLVRYGADGQQLSKKRVSKFESSRGEFTRLAKSTSHFAEKLMGSGFCLKCEVESPLSPHSSSSFEELRASLAENGCSSVDGCGLGSCRCDTPPPPIELVQLSPINGGILVTDAVMLYDPLSTNPRCNFYGLPLSENGTVKQKYACDKIHVEPLQVDSDNVVNEKDCLQRTVMEKELRVAVMENMNGALHMTSSAPQCLSSISVSHMKRHKNARGENAGPHKQCKYCGQTFTQYSVLAVHMLEHTGEEPYKCCRCEQTFSRKAHFAAHKLEHTDEEPYVSSHCERAFSRKRDWEVCVLEKPIKVEENLFKCLVCTQTFTRKGDLKVHVSKHKGDMMFKCFRCTQTFSEVRELEAHKESAHRTEKPYRCCRCEQSFGYKHDFAVHMLRHFKEEPSKGCNCVRPLCNRKALESYLKVRAGNSSYKCNTCQATFRLASALRSHKRKHTGERPYQCYYCERSFSQSSNLMTHMRRHTGERPFKCDLCSQAFSQMGHLKIHRRKHTGEQPYPCHHCRKRFNKKCNLTVHMRKHTGEKPFRCDHCEQAYCQKCDLVVHVRMKHTGERPYRCADCGQGFYQKGHLTVHTRIHTGEKPYHCPHCAHRFPTKVNLMKHTRQEHAAVNDSPGDYKPRQTETEQFECYHCGQGFRNKLVLVNHVKTHHIMI